MLSHTAPTELPVSPLTLSHQLLALAEQADRAGMQTSARSLLKLAHRVCVDRPNLLAPTLRAAAHA